MRGLLILSAAIVFAVAFPGARAGEEGRDTRHGTERSSVFTWEVDTKYPEMGQPEMDSQIREWVNNHVSQNIASFNDFVDVADLDLSWTMSTEYDTTAPSDRAVSIVFTTYTYNRGAAHPMRESEVITFATDSGKRLLLDDLFSDPEKALAIFSENAQRLVIENMKANYPEIFEGAGDPNDSFFEGGFDPTRENYAQIGLEPEGVRVYFQLYQVLPYVFGMPEALFTLDMLKDAGPKTEYWGK